jgi:hypothetical protein
MTRIICRANDCINWDDGVCTADKIVYDPDQGCLTYQLLDASLEGAEDWDDDFLDAEEDELEWDDDLDEVDDENKTDDDW